MTRSAIKTWAAVLGVLCAAVFSWLWFTGYVSLIPWCRVKIHHHVLSGDKGLIRKAISQLRASDEDGFRALCRYVDAIYERVCYGADWNITDASQWYRKPGCFVKGSRAVYLTPTKNQTRSAVANRAVDLGRFAKYAREFWEGRR